MHDLVLPRYNVWIKWSAVRLSMHQVQTNLKGIKTSAHLRLWTLQYGWTQCIKPKHCGSGNLTHGPYPDSVPPLSPPPPSFSSDEQENTKEGNSSYEDQIELIPLNYRPPIDRRWQWYSQFGFILNQYRESKRKGRRGWIWDLLKSNTKCKIENAEVFLISLRFSLTN